MPSQTQNPPQEQQTANPESSTPSKLKDVGHVVKVEVDISVDENRSVSVDDAKSKDLSMFGLKNLRVAEDDPKNLKMSNIEGPDREEENGFAKQPKIFDNQEGKEISGFSGFPAGSS